MSERVTTPTRPLSFRTGRHRQAAVLPHGRRSLRRWLRAALALLVLGLLGGGAVRLYLSSWLVISDVRVSGEGALSASDLRGTAAIAGQRFFTANTAAAVARLQALPRIKSARVSTHFPHAATIAVVERQPAGVWTVGGVAYLVDGAGVVLDTTTDAGGLPVVDATGAAVDVHVGGRVDADPLLIAARLSTFLPAMTGQQAAHIQYDRGTGVSVLTDRGTVVHLGDSQNLDFKLSVWQQVVATLNPAGLHELDLRDGDRPFYR